MFAETRCDPALVKTRIIIVVKNDASQRERETIEPGIEKLLGTILDAIVLHPLRSF